MEAALWVLGLATLAIWFVISKHGWGNTLIALGGWLFDAGTGFNRRTDERRAVVMKQWRERAEKWKANRGELAKVREIRVGTGTGVN